MKLILKIITILIVAILVIFSIYIALSTEPNSSNNKSDSDDDSDGDNNDNGDDNNDTNYKEFNHTVFIEEGTGTWCKGCPNAADLLYNTYSSGNYNFYYVAMIEDKNKMAHNRLYDDYNIQLFPTMFIDGGYKVVVGSDKTEFEQALKDTESRIVPEIRVTVNSEYDNKTGKINTNVLVENNESTTYTGVLKVYLTEIISHIKDYDKKPYHFGFIDYIYNKEISIDAKLNRSISTESYDISNLDPENLMIIAVIFSSESVKADSSPGKEGGEFDAYYADATNATKLIIEGNLPPSVSISLPEVGRLHFLGKPILDITFKNTILIGQTTIIAKVEDDSGIEKVEFYINGELKNTIKKGPYEYSFRKVKLLKRFIRRYTFTVKAYDDEGKTNKASINVIAFFL